MNLCRQGLMGASLLALTAGLAAAQQTTVLDTIMVEGEAEAEAAGGIALTQEDLLRLLPTTLNDIFRRESAVMVGGGSAASQRVHVNGLEESKLAVTVDGARQPGNFWHHSGTSQVDPAFLKSVEVRPGVAGADTGFATGAGSLRYETVDAADLLEDGRDFGGRVALGYGSNGYGGKGSVALFGRQGGFDWLAMVGRQNGKAYESGAGVEQRGTAPALESGLFKLGYASAEGHRLELSVDRSTDDALRLLRMNMDAVGGALPENRNIMERTTTVLRYSTVTPTAGWDPVAELWFNDFALERPDNGYLRPSGAFNLHNDSFGGKVQNSFSLAGGKITAGIDFMSSDSDLERFAYPGFTAAGFVREGSRQTGVFVQGDFDLGRGFGVAAGLRADQQRFDAADGQSFDNSGVSGNATVSWDVSDGVQLYASAGRSWMGLEQGEMALFHARDYTYDPHIKAAWASNYRLGGTIARGAWEGGLALFETTLHNPVAYDYTTVQRVSGSDLRSQGVELSLAYGWAAGKAGVKLTHADVTYASDTVTPGATDAAPMGTILTLFADHRIERLDLTLGASVEHAARLDDGDLIAAGYLAQPDYTVVDVYAEWSPERMRGLALRLGVDNLLDETYAARGTYPDYPGRGIDAVEAPGRTVSLTANYTF